MRYAGLTAVTAFLGAAAVSVASAAPEPAAVGHSVGAVRVTAAVVPAAGADFPAHGMAGVRGGSAEVLSVWCASAGSCAAGGDYLDQRKHRQGFVVSRRHGVWGRAIDVPGLEALNAGGMISALLVSCASAGNCAAGGNYLDRRKQQQGFVVSEKNGVWGRAIKIKVPGLGKLHTGGLFAAVTSVSCAPGGGCVVGGYYGDRLDHSRGFVVSEKNGVWGRAIGVPGLGALNVGGLLAEVTSVSCGAKGSCTAGGFYTDRSGNFQGFVVRQKNGVWDRAIEVPGLGTLNAGGAAEVLSVSCGPAGSCAAGGFYADKSGNDGQGFVVGEKNGAWGKAIEVPGLGTLNAGGSLAAVTSVSCAPGGNCAAGGVYTDRSGNSQGFVVSQDHGAWGRAIEVPGFAALHAVGHGFLGTGSVSCAPGGNCAAAGDYLVRSGQLRGFVVSERKGVWDRLVSMPGRSISGEVSSVSCASAAYCAAGGSLATSRLGQHGFVVTGREGAWGKPVRIAVPGGSADISR